MWLADLFLPSREDRFSSLLVKHAGILAEAAEQLCMYMVSPGAELSEGIDHLEKQADELLVQLTKELRGTFVTPIDRQDIYGLAETIDDMIDYLNNAAREIELFAVSPTTHMQAMTRELADAASDIAAAVKTLRTHPEEAWRKALQACAAENAVEKRYRAALAELFCQDDIHDIFKLREIYRHLSNSADRADAVGRLICRIVVKST